MGRLSRHVACAAFALLALLGAHAAGADAPVQTVAPGSIATVALAESNVVATCTPPGSFVPNPTVYSVNPSNVALLSGGPLDRPPTASDTVTISVPATLSSFQPIQISWTGNTTCVSFNGGVVIGVAARPTGPGATAPAPGEIVPPQATVRVRSCGSVTVGGRTIRVGTQDGPCSEARKAARTIARGKRPSGYRCVLSGPANDPRTIWVCSRGPTVVASGPPAARSLVQGNCGTVTHRARRYAVSAQKVTCRYARATVLRMLRNEQPYIYEFETPRQARRWTCPRRTPTHGACVKRVERRFVGYFLVR